MRGSLVSERETPGALRPDSPTQAKYTQDYIDRCGSLCSYCSMERATLRRTTLRIGNNVPPSPMNGKDLLLNKRIVCPTRAVGHCAHSQVPQLYFRPSTPQQRRRREMTHRYKKVLIYVPEVSSEHFPCHASC